ncbi:MAG: DUF6785 family protein [Candidatus Omnitrophota bacterium]
MAMKRAFLTGLVLSAGIAALEPLLLLKIQGNGLCSDFMTAGALLALLVVILLSGALSFVHRKLIFSPPELLLIFIMVSEACVVPSWGVMGNLFPVIAGIPYFASPANEWVATFGDKIKTCLVNQDFQSILYFYEGLPPNVPVSFLPWLKPLVVWFLPFLFFSFLSISLAVIFRKQWMENERLIFPLALVPLEMCRKETASQRLPSLFYDKVMWMGFAIPFILISINGLNYFFPAFKRISFEYAINIFRNTDSLSFLLSFPIMGFAYLLSLDIAFSLWFFHLVSKLQTGWFNVTGYSLPGHNEVFAGGSAATSFQGGGAMVVLFFFLIWTGRKHLSAVFRKAFGKGEADDSPEIISYRTAVFGGLISIILLAGFLSYAGMSFLALLLFLFFVLVVFLGLTRIISQAGIGFARSQCVPPDFTAYTLPPSMVKPSGYTALGLQYVWSSDIRTTVMASTANGLKIQEEAKIKPRLLFWGIIASLVVSYFISAWMIVKIGYRYGALNAPNGWFYGVGMPSAIANFIKDKITNPPTVQVILPRLGFAGLGAAVMLFLAVMRQKFLWWPLHYIGFPIADTYVMRYAWFSIFLAWLIKSLILRYGGPIVYRRTVPFFLGLILGLIGAVGVWTAINALSGQQINPILIGVG